MDNNDFTYLKNLKKIKKLNISQCSAYNTQLDISFLSEDNFKNLIELNINNNYIKDTSGLNNLKKLEKLNISHNCIKSLSFLSNENSCLIELNIYNNEIEDFSILKSLLKLEVIYYGSQRVELSPEMNKINSDIIKELEKNLRKCINKNKK